jgi:hypothetical protein
VTPHESSQLAPPNTVERAKKLKIDVDNKTETLLVIADAERDSEASDRKASSLHTGG